MSESDPRPSERRPTIYDVAAAAGVSKSLVSLVLRNSPQVSPARRAAVQAAITELGYRPSAAAAALASTSTRTVGVMLDDYRNLWFVELLAGMQQTLTPLGYRVAVADSTVSGSARSALDGFLSLRVDAVVVAMEPTDELSGVTGDVPVVVVGGRDHAIAGADVVANDDLTGGRLATRHLLDLGHRRVGHLTGPGGAARRRAEGFVATMTAAGLPAPVYAAPGTATEADGYHAARRLLAERPDLTAIFAANDTMALGVAGALHDAGLRYPEDVSLIGYDNSALASAHLLRLTTVDGLSHQIGVRAAAVLVARLADPGLPPGAQLVTPTLVHRHSTTVPRAD
ncbi:MAG: LacI family transcriptional regulator [Friedmanniella sp.]|nr:LacI family transcriptional regulator [Friedmanniella sp.]